MSWCDSAARRVRGDADQFRSVRRGFDRRDRFPDRLGLLEHQVAWEVFFLRLEVIRDPRQIRYDRLGVGAVGEEDLHQLGSAVLARPGILIAGVDHERFHAILDVVLRQEAQPFHPDLVGEHLAARARLKNRLVDGGQQGRDLFERETAVDRSDAAAGPTVQSSAAPAEENISVSELDLEALSGEDINRLLGADPAAQDVPPSPAQVT